MEELNVKVGDEVLFEPAGFMREECIAKVIHVTKTGRVRIDKSGAQFDKYGREMGGRNAFYFSYIRILTPEKREEIIKREAITKCIHCVKKHFRGEDGTGTYEQAIEILKILGEE